jgi:hypothetical protein
MALISKTTNELTQAWENGAVTIWAAMYKPGDTTHVLVFVTIPTDERTILVPEVWDVSG